MSRKQHSAGRLSLMVSIAAALISSGALAQTSGSSSDGPANQQPAEEAARDRDADEKTGKQKDQPVTLQQMKVTAQRYGTALEKTPVAVTALNAQVLSDRQIVDVEDLGSQVPGVQISQATSSTSQMKVTFRGARTETGGIRANGTVGVYVDNVIQPRPNGAFFNLFDVDQVEVLRGPQGTLYGRNTSGGAIKLQTKVPSYYWAGTAEVAAGNFGSLSEKVYVSGPIIKDKLAFSLAGMHEERDGFVYGLEHGRRIGGKDLSAERLKILFQPTETVTFDLALYGIQDHSDLILPTPLALLPGVVDPYAFRGRDLTIYEMYANLGQWNKQKGASLNASWQVTENLTLDSITGYGNMEAYNEGNDTFLTAQRQAANGGRLDISNNIASRLTDSWFTQEFNALYTSDRLEAIIGLYYFREEGRQSNITSGTATNLEKSLTTAPAIFGQATYTIGGGVSVVGGLRHTRETTDYFSYTFSSPAGPQVGRSVFTSNTPKLGINWQVNPNLFTYASWTRGTRSGGFNTRDLNGNLAPTPYGAEWVDSYELGGKFISADRKFSLNASLYQADYTDQQLARILAGPGYVAIFYENAGASQVRGLELESNWRVSNDLFLYAIAAFQEGKYTKPFFCNNQRGVRVDCTKKHLKGLPAQKWSLGFKYTPTIQMLPGQLSFNGSWDHNSKIYNTIANPLPPPDDYGPTPKLDLFNASVSWVDDAHRWRVALEARNLTNKHYVDAGFTQSNPINPGVVGYLGNPRETWIRVGYSF